MSHVPPHLAHLAGSSGHSRDAGRPGPGRPVEMHRRIEPLVPLPTPAEAADATLAAAVAIVRRQSLRIRLALLVGRLERLAHPPRPAGDRPGMSQP